MLPKHSANLTQSKLRACKLESYGLTQIFRHFFFTLPHFTATFQYFCTRDLQTQQTPNQKSNPKQALFRCIFLFVVLPQHTCLPRNCFTTFRPFQFWTTRLLRDTESKYQVRILTPSSLFAINLGTERRSKRTSRAYTLHLKGISTQNFNRLVDKKWGSSKRCMIKLLCHMGI
jgi:hypothetical protein